MNLLSIRSVAAGLAFFGLAGLYRRCPANRVLVISGKVGGEGSARCISGGGAFVWPVIQEYAYLSLEPIQIDIPLKDALSFANIRVAVPSVCTVAIEEINRDREAFLHRIQSSLEPELKRSASC